MFIKRVNCHRSLSSPVTGSSLVPKKSTTPALTEQTVLHEAVSSSSLFGTELTDEFRALVKKLGRHIVFGECLSHTLLIIILIIMLYSFILRTRSVFHKSVLMFIVDDCEGVRVLIYLYIFFVLLVNMLISRQISDAERCQAIMSSNLVAWVTAFMYRETGVSSSTLSKEVAELREVLSQRGRDVGFTGSAEDAVQHAVSLLGPSLIETTGQLYRPPTLLPNIIELSYYANALLPVFALDGIIATSLLNAISCPLEPYIDCETDITVSMNTLMSTSMRLSEILSQEFVFVAPCDKLSLRLENAVDRLVLSGLLDEVVAPRKSRHYDANDWLAPNYEEEQQDSGSSDKYVTLYKVVPTAQTLKYLRAFSNMMRPILDAYCIAVESLPLLLSKQMLEAEFVVAAQATISEKLANGSLSYGKISISGLTL